MGRTGAPTPLGAVRLVAAALICATMASCGEGPGPVTGLVVDVQGDLSNVSAFTVLVEGGDRLVFTPAPDGDFAFPLPHLRDHLRSGEPVQVTYREEEGGLIATGVRDG